MTKRKKRNNTKNLISLALYTLMKKRDYDEISVKDICERAGVSRMSFYRYYRMKDDIFINYCDERFEEFYSRVNSIKDLTINDFTLKMFQFIDEYKRQIKVLFQAHREFMLLDQLNSYSKYIISNLKSDYFKEQKNNPIFAYFMSGGLFNVIVYWMNASKPLTPEQMNEMLYAIPSKGL